MTIITVACALSVVTAVGKLKLNGRAEIPDLIHALMCSLLLTGHERLGHFENNAPKC